MSEEIAVENLDPDMTCRDLVRLFFGDVSDREADHFLWSATAFPFNNVEGLVAGIRKMHERSGGDIGRAVELAHEDMDRAYEEYQERKMSDKMEELRHAIAEKLVEIEDILEERGLGVMSGITLVARDPNNPLKMNIVITSGGEEEMQGAADVLVSPLEEFAGEGKEE